MGHKSNSEIFSSYMSKTSGVDVQGMYRGSEQADLRQLMGISLNKKDDAPTRISAAGYEEALSDPDYVKIASQICEEGGGMMIIRAVVKSTFPPCCSEP